MAESANSSVCVVGAGQVIPGWEEGLLDMCLNEKRVLTIPSRKAYGASSPTKRGYIYLRSI